jgi:peptidoglycan/xylan/chitin deacetylase (PgdA/CDA1 family)
MIATLFAAALLAAAPREIAITFDDLPDIGNNPLEVQQALTTRLLDALKAENVPAIGFVNEDKLLDDEDRPDPKRIALVAQWLDAGEEIGNHTYAHVDLEHVPVEEFEHDVLRGETMTRPLLQSHGKTLQWFRHPYLDTGATASIRNEIAAFLAEHGYRVAPVTIDDSEWIYDLAYDRAPWWQRAALRRSYIRYMQRRFEWAESMSRLVFHRDVAQVLLLHASSLNADVFPRLAAMIRGRGYRFVAIDDAMRDAAYASQESAAVDGVGWLERWGVARGIAPSRFEHDPRVPPWVQKLAGARDE